MDAIYRQLRIEKKPFRALIDELDKADVNLKVEKKLGISF